jgi:transcriptional regulator with XRE-family HTH domain
MGLKNLREARSAKGYSQALLARELGMHAPEICNIESGIDIGVLQALGAEMALEQPIQHRNDNDPLTVEETAEMFSLLAGMAHRFPSRSLLAFGHKVLNSIKIDEGDKLAMIRNAAKVAKENLMKGGT